MYPSWGNFGGQQTQNYGGSVPRKPIGDDQTSSFGGFEASPAGSLFPSLHEQHLQQMQQLQMLHQKQLQSVLNHASHPNSYSAGHSSGYSETSWHSEPPQPTVAPGPPPGHQQQPAPVCQPLDCQPVPHAPEVKPPENGSHEDCNGPTPPTEDTQFPLQVGERDQVLALCYSLRRGNDQKRHLNVL